MVNSCTCLSSCRLMVAFDWAASNFVMVAKLAFWRTSTRLIKLASDFDSCCCCCSPKESCEFGDTTSGFDASLIDDEIVSSKELNLVKFIIQPSSFRNSSSSLTFCQLTFKLVDETASTITYSGCPGSEFIPSATPAS